MRQHPVIGERIIRAIPGMAPVARVVRHQHERWDGNGYPDGLAGTEIPVEARIILACDAYHALTSDRPYRAAVSHEDALVELTANAETQFDPKVIEGLLAYLYGRRQSGLAAV
jgi:HD-GYP domain-containing protein (c-di-GMP phosphodiesterase class II)